jgi:hypothetical protein
MGIATMLAARTTYVHALGFGAAGEPKGLNSLSSLQKDNHDRESVQTMRQESIDQSDSTATLHHTIPDRPHVDHPITCQQIHLLEDQVRSLFPPGNTSFRLERT